MLLIQINRLKTLRHYPRHKHGECVTFVPFGRRWGRLVYEKHFGFHLGPHRKESFGQFGPLGHRSLLLPSSSNYKNVGNLWKTTELSKNLPNSVYLLEMDDLPFGDR